MDSATHPPQLNTLLKVLPAETFASIFPMLEPVRLPRMFKMAEVGEPCQWMYFPTDGVAAVIGHGIDSWQEIGVFGREGAGCFTRLLGSDVAIYSVIMQVPGQGYRIATADILSADAACGRLRELMLRYIHTFMFQMAQTAMANGRFNIVQRLARWRGSIRRINSPGSGEHARRRPYGGHAGAAGAGAVGHDRHGAGAG